MMPNRAHTASAKQNPSLEWKKIEEGGTETESSSASEANKNAGKAQVIGDAVYSKVMDGLLNQN
jgi:hypothetical protein